MKRELRGGKVYIWRGNMVVFGFGFDRSVGLLSARMVEAGRDKNS